MLFRSAYCLVTSTCCVDRPISDQIIAGGIQKESIILKELRAMHCNVSGSEIIGKTGCVIVARASFQNSLDYVPFAVSKRRMRKIHPRTFQNFAL